MFREPLPVHDTLDADYKEKLVYHTNVMCQVNVSYYV